MIDFSSINQVKREFESLLRNTLDKYGYVFFSSVDEAPAFLKLIYKSSIDKVLIIDIEPGEGRRSVDFSVGKYNNGKIIDKTYLITAMETKGADLAMVREKAKVLKKNNDNWFEDEIKRILIFIDKFGDLVL